MTDYAPIIEMLEKLDGPDREVDARIAYIADVGEGEGGLNWRKVVETHDFEWKKLVSRMDVRTSVWSSLILPYTASLDATIALVEKMLPGWGYQHGKPLGDRGHYASVFRERGDKEFGFLPGHFDDYRGDLTEKDYQTRPRSSYRPNGAIALLIAMFKAIQDQEQPHE